MRQPHSHGRGQLLTHNDWIRYRISANHEHSNVLILVRDSIYRSTVKENFFTFSQSRTSLKKKLKGKFGLVTLISAYPCLARESLTNTWGWVTWEKNEFLSSSFNYLPQRHKPTVIFKIWYALDWLSVLDPTSQLHFPCAQRFNHHMDNWLKELSYEYKWKCTNPNRLMHFRLTGLDERLVYLRR